MQTDTPQKDYSKMKKDELEKEALELRQKIESKKKIVREKSAFIKAKMLEEYPELKPELDELEKTENEELENEVYSIEPNTKKEPATESYAGMRTIKRMPAVPQNPRPQAPVTEKREVIQEKRIEQKTELNKPVQTNSDFSDNTKREIEELRKKLQTLERKEEYTKPIKTQTPGVVERRSESSPVLRSALSEPEKRYGVEPAKDLGAGDFDWQGNVGGVEIEKSVEESEEKEELEKAKILEEIEHPPSYAETVTPEKRPEKFEKATSEPEEEKSKEELEKARATRYKGEDPYREPVE